MVQQQSNRIHSHTPHAARHCLCVYAKKSAVRIAYCELWLSLVWSGINWRRFSCSGCTTSLLFCRALYLLLRDRDSGIEPIHHWLKCHSPFFQHEAMSSRNETIKFMILKWKQRRKRRTTATKHSWQRLTGAEVTHHGSSLLRQQMGWVSSMSHLSLHSNALQIPAAFLLAKNTENEWNGR